MNAQAYDQYRKTSVETVAPEKLLLMLFDGALKNINNAKKAIEDKDINRSHQEIIKAQDIVIELMSTLNMDFDISHSLFLLYEYMHNQLVQANIKKDVVILEEVEVFFAELRETWNEAMVSLKNTPASTTEPVEKPAQVVPLVVQENNQDVDNPTNTRTTVGGYAATAHNKAVYSTTPALKTFNTSTQPGQRQGINIKG